MPSSPDIFDELKRKLTITSFSFYVLGAALLPASPPLGIAIMLGGGITAVGISASNNTN